MAVLISMLRGVNLGSHNRVKMDALCDLYEELKLESPRTYVQSGNVIFTTKEKDTAKLTKKIQNAIEKTFQCRPEVILRTTGEMKKAVAANPFSGRRNIEPGKLLVTFLAAEPPQEAQASLAKLVSVKKYPEELHIVGRELYIYFPNGAGKSRLPWSQVDRLLKVTGTARNWNSVLAILKMAQELEADR
jgi:uncharacterized protein (DUF1697 family)